MQGTAETVGPSITYVGKCEPQVVLAANKKNTFSVNKIDYLNLYLYIKHSFEKLFLSFILNL